MQRDFWRKDRSPAKPNPRTMFVIDAGTPGAGGRACVRFECTACGHETGWLRGRSATAEKNGRVCPVCQGDVAKVQGNAP